MAGKDRDRRLARERYERNLARRRRKRERARRRRVMIAATVAVLVVLGGASALAATLGLPGTGGGRSMIGPVTYPPDATDDTAADATTRTFLIVYDQDHLSPVTVETASSKRVVRQEPRRDE